MKRLKYIIGIILVISFSLILKSNSLLAATSFLTVDDEVDINEDILITVNLPYIDYDTFRMTISSNQSLDTLSSESVTFEKDEDSSYFEYNINASTTNRLILKYKLPSTINAGDKITFYIVLTNKENETETTDIRKTITVVDNSSTNDENNNQNNHSGNNTPSVRPNSVSHSSFKIGSFSSSSKKVTYPGSDNNYLKSLSVSNYSFNRKFSKDGLTYFVTVKNNVKSLKITAKAEGSKSKVSITGNSNFTTGVNKVLITVTAESGLTRQYRIYVIKEEA